MDEYKVGDKVYIKIKEKASSYRACKHIIVKAKYNILQKNI